MVQYKVHVMLQKDAKDQCEVYLHLKCSHNEDNIHIMLYETCYINVFWLG